MTTPALQQQPTPVRFFNAINAYELSEAINTALELEIFTAIAEGNTTAAMIAKRCKVAERGARILCDFLTIHGFLTKEGAHYVLAPDSALFLNRHSQAYVGSATEFLLTQRLRECHAQLTEAVRRGGTALSEGMLEPENPDWVKFAHGMMPLMHKPSEIIAAELRKDGEAHKVLDIAACHGIFGISVAKQNPAAHIYASDWKNVLEVAWKNAQAMGVADRYHLLPGSAFESDFGTGYDLALIANFLHALNPRTCTTLMRKVYAALNPGGRVAIAEFVPNPDRVSPPTAAAFSLMMLAATPSGDAYTFAELESISQDAGFTRVELAVPEIGINRLVIAYRGIYERQVPCGIRCHGQEKEMLNQATATHGVMEGGGSYNRHAGIPAGGGLLALPFLEQAARNVTLEGGEQPVVIADYGCSQGKNSLTPMRTAIKALRKRLGSDRAISVVHVDQAANDFNTLFEVLQSDPERYRVDDPAIFSSAIGRSFYEPVFPREHVHLGWSSYAAVWLSRIPMLIPGHFVVLASNGDVRAAFQRQAANDWKLFLSLRASELKPGGRLVVVLPGLNDGGSAGLEPLFGHASDALADVVADGSITAEDRARMVLGAYPRRRSELLAPFAMDAQFRGLTVEHCELSVLPDAAWEDYETDANKEALATRHARFFRSVFAPSLGAMIADEGQRNLFPDRLEEKLKRRLADHPAPFHTYVQTIVLAKQGGTPTPAIQN